MSLRKDNQTTIRPGQTDRHGPAPEPRDVGDMIVGPRAPLRHREMPPHPAQHEAETQTDENEPDNASRHDRTAVIKREHAQRPDEEKQYRELDPAEPGEERGAHGQRSIHKTRDECQQFVILAEA